jgi:methyl-accepting chemotaxis protein
MMGLKDLKMKPKLIGAFLVVGLLPLATIGMVSLKKAETAIETETFAKLEAVQAIKVEQIQGFYQDRMNDVVTLAANPFVQQAFLDLDAALDAGGGSRGGSFRGSGDFSYSAPDEYKAIHDLYFDTFKDYMEQYGYYDVFLMCPDKGDVSFTVYKESDFGQRSSDIANSSLKDVWRVAALQGQAALSDIKPYAPSAGAPAQFIAAPIKVDGEVIGVVALQVSADSVNTIMQNRAGMGETGEAYLVGSDKRMRSDSFLDPEGHSLTASLAGTVASNGVDTEAVNLALAGESGSSVILDYNGAPVLSVYSPVEIAPGVKWICIAEMDMAEVDLPIDSLRSNVLMIGGVISLLIAGFALWLASNMVGPIKKIGLAAKEMANGDFDQTVDIHQKDEIGELALAFGEMGESIRSKAAAAEQIGQGNLAVDIKVASEADNLGKAMVAMRQAIGQMAEETDSLVNAAVEGRLNERADSSQFQGSFKQVIEGVNTALSALVGHIDAIPAPATIIDTEFNVQYMNKAALAVTGQTPEVAFSSKCHQLFKTSDCQTESCALHKAMRNGSQATSETDAHPGGNDLEISYTGVPVKDQSGKIIGALEVVTDLTAIKHAAAKAEKVKHYQDGEVDKLTTVLDKVALGDLNSKAEVAEADRDTAETREVFQGIAGAVNQTIDAIGALVRDTDDLATAAKNGNLQTRADAGKHGGDFGRVITGINETLDAVVDPISEASQVLEQMAGKNLSSRVAGDYKGDHAKIKSTLNSALENVGESMGMVIAGADQVSSASGQISVGAQSLAQGASEQASSIEEISSSLQEMTSMARKNSENADEARNLTSAANTASDQGMDAMRRLSGAIDKIKDSSSDTAKIIKTIDEIAFQTNLLALNASVEAARAGDAGKGFAVVAEEVRNLAMRSTEAAKSTSELIEESVSNSEEGVAINNEVLEKLEEITSKVQSVNEVMVEIASSSNQQNSSLGQVADAIEQLNLVTQQNAANSEESASSAEELQSQAQEMLQMVGAFKLQKGSGVRPAATPAKPIKHEVGGSETKTDSENQLIGVPASKIPLDESEMEILGEF